MSLDSRGVDSQRFLPLSLEDRLVGFCSRIGGAVLMLAVVALWASLVSWSSADPSLTHATSGTPRNLLGPIGAALSDLMLQTFGFAAGIALVAPMFWSIEMMASERLNDGRLKSGFYPLSIIGACGALSAFPVLPGWPLHHGLGGILGDAMFGLASSLFAMINSERAGLAASIVLVAFALTSIAKSIGLDRHDVKLLAASMLPRFSFSRFRAQMAAAATASSRWTQKRPRFVEPVRYAEETPSAHWTDAGDEHDQNIGFSSVVPEPMAARIDPTLSIDGPAVSSATEPDLDVSRIAPAFAPGDRLFDHGLASEPVHIFTDEPTDESSRAIAQRFAPARAGRDNAQYAIDPAPLRQKRPSRIDNAPTHAKPVLPRAIATLAPRRVPSAFQRPSLNLLHRSPAGRVSADHTPAALRSVATALEDALLDFGVKGQVRDIKPGPVVTLFEFEPARGTKSSRVIGLADDIARSLSMTAVRASVVPGRNVIGIELPNKTRDAVFLRELLETSDYRTGGAVLPIALGKSIGGEPVIADLARMPHLLVAGTTGSGKSVGINGMILSLTMKHSPEECRLLMIDPKMLELSVYNGIPHLLSPVVTDPHQAVDALRWAVHEMEERYKRMAKLGVRNIDVYNNRVLNAKKRGELLSRTVQTGFDAATGQAVYEDQPVAAEPLPRIVVVIDEFADLMVVAGKDVEAAVQRLAQMARAAGIHLLMATQRPSVDVITGTIKANFPTRLSYKVTSRIDSRTILNESGAEQLLGQGDMLYAPGSGVIVRLHGAFVSDDEVESVAQALRAQGAPEYVEAILAPRRETPANDTQAERQAAEDEMYNRAVALVAGDGRASISYLQRRLGIGYNRAATLVERMERERLISPASSSGRREILAAVSESAAPLTG